MKLERIDPGACDTGANENCVLNSAAYSKNPAKTQARTIPPMPDHGSAETLADWKARLARDGFFLRVEVITENIGPVHLLKSRDNGSHSPLVCVGFGPSWTFVWVEPGRLPWGCSDPQREFFSRNHRGAAVKYALGLAESFRKAALKQQERIERQKAAYLRERSGGGL